MAKFPNTPFQQWLEQHKACDEGRAFVGAMTPQEAWDAAVAYGGFVMGQWMRWLLRHIGLSAVNDAAVNQCSASADPCACAANAHRLLPILPDFLVHADPVAPSGCDLDAVLRQEATPHD